MPSNSASIFTTTISGKFNTPEGALEIFMKNTGSASATFTGNKKNLDDGTPSSAITLAKGDSYAFGYIGKGRASFLIDATGTTVDLSITF